MTPQTSPGFFSEPRDRTPITDWPWWCAADAADEPGRFLRACPLYRPTPLRRLDALAESLGLGGLAVKDETSRLNLGSFKALGGAYAVLRIAARRAANVLGRPVEPSELLSAEVRAAMADLTLCCASDGNHGRAVAAGARLVGARCAVFLHAGVSAERAAHIERLGAAIIRVAGSYDESVAASAAAARERGWTPVADTASAEDAAEAEICGFVMQGYSVLVEEILEEARARSLAFTHVFVQAGVGGLAASVFGHWTARTGGGTAPAFVVVEPEHSDGLLQSRRAGHLVRLPESRPTIMAMLECQSPSPLAWPVVRALAGAYLAVNDEAARRAVRLLARPVGQDPAIEAGESGAAGLAGLLQGLADPAQRAALRLDGRAHVLLVVTEQPTDRSLWSGRPDA